MQRSDALVIGTRCPGKILLPLAGKTIGVNVSNIDFDIVYTLAVIFLELI